MNPNKGDYKELFLIAGDDYEKIVKSQCFSTTLFNVNFYIVENKKIILSSEGYKCSCGETFCWHILKIMFTEKFTTKIATVDDFLIQ